MATILSICLFIHVVMLFGSRVYLGRCIGTWTCTFETAHAGAELQDYNGAGEGVFPA